MGFIRFLLTLMVLCAAFCKDGMAKKHHRKQHSKSNGSKIVGGHDATIQDYPYQAFLLLKKGEDDYYQCGGAIVSTSYILSAAHCFEDIKSVTVRIGSTEKFSGGQEYTASFERHEHYNPKSKDFDIAYVKTDQEMELDGVNAKTVPIVDKGNVIPSGSIIKVSGWGATSEGGDTTDSLRAVEVPTVTNEQCNKKHTVALRQFCAGYEEGGRDHCKGDSGGPAVLSESSILVGMVSAGYGCARKGEYGIYVNLTDTDIRDWVQEKTGL